MTAILVIKFKKQKQTQQTKNVSIHNAFDSPPKIMLDK